MKSRKKEKEQATILIADDSPTIRGTLGEILKKEGYRVLAAADGIQAAEMAFAHHPDLIVSDIEMPNMDGYQVCRLLKNDPNLAQVPVIILTSKDSSGSAFWSYQTGADHYVLKDAGGGELIKAIATLLEKTSSQRELLRHLPPEKADAQQILEKLNRFLDRQLFEMTMINEINRITVSLQTISETLHSLLCTLDRAIDNQVSGFAVFLEDKQILVSVRLNRETPPRLLELIEYHILEDLALMVNEDISNYRIQVELLEEHLCRQTGDKQDELDPRCLYSLPIRAKEENFGVFNVFHPNMSRVPAYQKQLLEKLAPYVSTAISTTAMHNRIKSLSVIDGLTQLYNRRHLMDMYKIEFNKAVRYKSEISLLMIDIDDFKNVNDSHGHLSGDMVLKNISTIIRSNIRNVDLPGRYGGEEFLLILPETGRENALHVAERIRSQVEALATKTVSGENISVTVSIGLSSLSDLKGKSNELELIKFADARMYQAKRSGKNRVVAK